MPRSTFPSLTPVCLSSLVTGEHPLPNAVPSSGQLTFELTAVLPDGEGVIHWAPGGLQKPLVSWDFIVEDD